VKSDSVRLATVSTVSRVCSNTAKIFDGARIKMLALTKARHRHDVWLKVERCSPFQCNLMKTQDALLLMHRSHCDAPQKIIPKASWSVLWSHFKYEPALTH
jgi:hypothetical protein